MKCPKCESKNTKKVGILDADWESGSQRCLDCGYKGKWSEFIEEKIETPG